MFDLHHIGATIGLDKSINIPCLDLFRDIATIETNRAERTDAMMTVKNWHYSTQGSAETARPYVWREAMDTMCLPMPEIALGDDFHAEVVGMVSPTGIEFSRLSASPLTISGSYQNQQAGLWLAVLLDGRSVFSEAGDRIALSRGDILYGPSRRDSTLELHADFRMLYVRMPINALHPGLVDPGTLRSGILPGDSRLTRMLTGMLLSVGDELEAFASHEIHPVEVALSEFLVASLADAQPGKRFGDRIRAAHFHRICQSIDQQLGDAELSLSKLTEQQGVSPRYLQKLFEEAGLTFSIYLRDRRLARCHADLCSSAHGALSVSEICFRWGFNDAAHFSRSFRAKYGITPRECRTRQMRVTIASTRAVV